MAVSSSEAEAHAAGFEILNKGNMEEEGKSQMTVVSSSEIDGNRHEADTTNEEVTNGAEPDPTNAEVSGSLTGRKLKRYLQVYGYESRANDVVYAPPLSKEDLETDVESSTRDHDKDRLTVYFGGDLQDFPEAMDIISTQSREHVQWNLVNTAAILQNQFPDRHIIVIRPCRLQDRIYSCFDNFLPTAGHGNPEHTPNHSAISHLKTLLSELGRRINTDRLKAFTNGEGDADEDGPNKAEIRSRLKVLSKGLPGNSGPVNFDSAPEISLVGFSKGCVVLNQFLYEFHYLKTLTPDDSSFEKFLESIRDIYWLDGGHSGTKNTWIVSRSLLETLTRLDIRVHVHVTPYQIQDEQRAVIRREEKLFSSSLRSFGANIQRFVHFENLPPSLTLHFQLLTEFGAPTTRSTFQNEDWEEDENGGMASYDPNRKLPEIIYDGSHSDDLMDLEEDEEEDEDTNLVPFKKN